MNKEIVNKDFHVLKNQNFQLACVCNNDAAITLTAIFKQAESSKIVSGETIASILLHQLIYPCSG